jgi:hypothetical protein
MRSPDDVSTVFPDLDLFIPPVRRHWTRGLDRISRLIGTAATVVLAGIVLGRH